MLHETLERISGGRMLQGAGRCMGLAGSRKPCSGCCSVLLASIVLRERVQRTCDHSGDSARSGSPTAPQVLIQLGEGGESKYPTNINYLLEESAARPPPRALRAELCSDPLNFTLIVSLVFSCGGPLDSDEHQLLLESAAEIAGAPRHAE